MHCCNSCNNYHSSSESDLKKFLSYLCKYFLILRPFEFNGNGCLSIAFMYIFMGDFFCIIGLLVFGLGHCFDYKVLCLMNPLLVEICLGYFLHCFYYIVSL